MPHSLGKDLHRVIQHSSGLFWVFGVFYFWVAGGYMARYGEKIVKLLEFPSRYPESMLRLATPTLTYVNGLKRRIIEFKKKRSWKLYLAPYR